jgi:yecA family protein
MTHTTSEYRPLDFDDFANQLLAAGAQESPAYLHGGLCGVYAGAGPVTPEDCLAAVSQALDMPLQGELAESCLQLAGFTAAALEDEEFGFQLYLPGDEVDIDQRVQALSDWCRGFLAGYALVATSDSDAGLDKESGESLADIAAIAEAAVDAEADDEESESHYYEISEYLRFATLNLFMNRLAEGLAEGLADSDGQGAERSNGGIPS